MNLKQYVHAFWYKKHFSFSDYLLLLVFLPCSLLYRAGFWLMMRFKKIKGQRRCPWFKVISVGNLSVGGTGKTVFVQFLLSFLADKQGGVVLRGYRGSQSSRNKGLVVSDGKKIFASVEQCGDEPFMLAYDSKVPVAICKNRFLACLLLSQTNKLDYVILDDAYQNVDVVKDIEILLVDARYPVWKAHYFPAGFLREKDYSRADVIVLTHTRMLSEYQRITWVQFFKEKKQSLFWGDYTSTGLFLHNQGDDQVTTMYDKQVLAMAGIGNIAGFVKSIKSYGIFVAHVIDFGDHYAYTKDDIVALVATCQQFNIESIVTTSKDWYKLVSILRAIEHEVMLPKIYVLRVKFEFLSHEQYDHFHALINTIVR